MEDEANLKSIQNAANIMINCLKNGGKIIACGNGGSMCDAMHFASELTGRYKKDRPAIAALAIGDPAHLSCVGNDYRYEEVFSRYVHTHGNKSDVLLALSTSGNSNNVSLAIDLALRKTMNVVFISGSDGGKIGKFMEDKINRTKSIYLQIPINERYQPINIPHSGTADRTQEVSIIVLHILVHLIEKGLGYE
jgi:D-sedoheptulose 7-phosphate isomerase